MFNDAHIIPEVEGLPDISLVYTNISIQDYTENTFYS